MRYAALTSRRIQPWHHSMIAWAFGWRALFVSFAPLEDPQIAVAVIVENGEAGSSVAAPIARAVTDAWLK